MPETPAVRPRLRGVSHLSMFPVAAGFAIPLAFIGRSDTALASAIVFGVGVTAVRNGTRRSFAERGGAIGRQRTQRNVPAVVVEPFLDVAAGTRYFERAVIVLQKDDMIRQPAETAEHHVFIAGQALARP